MAQQTWKCTVCETEFKAGEWLCNDGVSNHVIAEKKYRSLDAPTDPSTKDASLKHGRTVVCNIPPPKRVMEGDSVKLIGEGSVEFIRGQYSTTDPEKQYWLDKKPGYNATEEQWRGAWLSQNQKLELKEMELTAREQRIENDRNELLTQVQNKTKREAVGVR